MTSDGNFRSPSPYLPLTVETSTPSTSVVGNAGEESHGQDRVYWPQVAVVSEDGRLGGGYGIERAGQRESVDSTMVATMGHNEGRGDIMIDGLWGVSSGWRRLLDR